MEKKIKHKNRKKTKEKIKKKKNVRFGEFGYSMVDIG
jgi:hypothetical protein